MNFRKLDDWVLKSFADQIKDRHLKVMRDLVAAIDAAIAAAPSSTGEKG